MNLMIQASGAAASIPLTPTYLHYGPSRSGDQVQFCGVAIHHNLRPTQIQSAILQQQLKDLLAGSGESNTLTLEFTVKKLKVGKNETLAEIELDFHGIQAPIQAPLFCMDRPVQYLSVEPNFANIPIGADSSSLNPLSTQQPKPTFNLFPLTLKLSRNLKVSPPDGPRHYWG